ncbi:lysozyme inhibitor LprI family protein [Sulfurovum sp. NBC37-1]|uniref:lysozyme inhibitor LprI family protein n=1 Tax=Sulfurovum sp. (strain NBC37-1) TaxID=387093 RepID=UPI00015874CD|nr:lysozyme inhibitor LprI family protein [Sulfurovum sp. NBC37-1]BAF71773.1 conserved hypothetical protein [Sulfurovum sp. NBC37-1]
MRVVLLILLSVNVLMSQEPDFQKCYDSHPATNDWMQCAYHEYDYRDKQLNAVYRHVKNHLPKEEIPNLIKAQRAWITFRDRECCFEAYEMRGGSAEKQFTIGCKIALTRERVQSLRTLLP